MTIRPSIRADGFEDTFRALFPQAKRVAERVLGRSGQAEDAAAEAFARALASWRRVGRLPYRDAWILRVTANVAIDMARKRHRREPTASDDLPHDDRHTGHPTDDAVTTRLALVAALERLPRRQREVVTLRYLADLSETAVADCLGVAVGTVQRHAHRGVRSLRRHLGPDIEEASLAAD